MIIKILKNVLGFKGNNDIIFVGGKESPSCNVIYIGGDIQDLKCNMKNYNSYCLESTASLLFNRYEKLKLPVHVYAIRPSLYKNSFAIFKNFMELVHVDHPIYKIDPQQAAAKQLQTLIQSSVTALLSDKSVDLLPNDGVPIHLIGFSKGCMVLTQLLYDLSQTTDKQLSAWFDNIHHITWLDSGHNGDAELWPISSVMITKFSETFNTRLHAFGTPFQLKRVNRERSLVEYHLFSDILQSLDYKHQCGKILEGNSNSLETHFKSLEIFPIFVD